MANHASAEKRIRRNAKRAMINRNRLSRLKTFLKKVEAAIAEGNATEAAARLQEAQPELDRGAAKGVIHPKTASRKMMRLSQRIKSLKAAA